MKDIEDDPDAETIQTYMARMTKVLFLSVSTYMGAMIINLRFPGNKPYLFLWKARTVPRVFIEGQCVGGYDDLLSLQKSGDLEKRLQGAGAI